MWFTKLGISVTVHITIDEDELVVSIPGNDITEKERYLLMSLQVLPSFGSSNHQDEGYILQPDGSGALLLYKNYNQRSSTLSSVSIPVYSSFTYPNFYSTTHVINDWMKASDAESASFPLYGVKKGSDAFLAYMTLGDAGTSILVSPEDYIVEFNRVCFSY